MKNALFIAVASLLAIVTTPAQASTYIFGWVTSTNANTNLGLSYSETVNGITLTALSLTAPSNLSKPATAGPDLYAQSGGTGDTGLGLVPQVANDGVQVDFADAIATLPNATAILTVAGLQSGESWAIYGSNTQLTVEGNSKTDGALGQPLASGTDKNGQATASVTLPDWGQYTYYTLMETGSTSSMCMSQSGLLLGEVTISGGVTTTTQTPEPGSLVMAGSALIGFALLLKRKRA